jgi:hypothetical protein
MMVSVVSFRVDEHLPSLADEFKIGQDRNGMKHIALKCEATRKNSKSSPMNGDSRSEDNGSNDGVNYIVCVTNILRRIAVEDSS